MSISDSEAKKQLPESKDQKNDIEITDISKDNQVKDQAKEQKPVVKRNKTMERGCKKRFPQIWILYCIIGGAIMGIGCFITASNLSHYGFVGIGYQGPGVLSILIVIKIVLQVRETYFIPKDDQIIIWTDENGKFHWNNLKSLIGISLTNIWLLCGFNVAWGFAEKGGLNQGIISSLMGLTSVINCIFFYFIFRQKLHWTQVIGVISMLSVIVFLAIEAASKEDTAVVEDGDLQVTEDTKSQRVYAAFALIIGSINPISMTIKHLVIKRYTSTYPPLMQAVDGFMIDALAYTFVAIYYEAEYGLIWDEIMIGTIGGFLISSGRTLIQISVSFGIAGPAQALFSTYSLWQAVLSARLAGQTLTLNQILSLAFCIFSVAMMGPIFFLVKQCEIKKAKRDKLGEVKPQDNK